MIMKKNNIKKLAQQFLEKHSYFKFIWQTLDEQTKDKILELVAEGKGIMLYEKVIDINSLSKSPDQKFFTHTEFYRSLKQSNLSLVEYENAKYLYEILNMRNLGDMNDLYNAQDVILLCEIIENRFQQMYEKYDYNSRKCNSASTLSGCVLNIDQSFQAFKNQNYKTVYKIKLDGDTKYNDYRVTSKIIKFDENNQYGFAMTKPMPVGSVKDKDPSWAEFNLLM